MLIITVDGSAIEVIEVREPTYTPKCFEHDFQIGNDDFQYAECTRCGEKFNLPLSIDNSVSSK